MRLNASGDIVAGGAGQGGTFELRDGAGKSRARLNADDGKARTVLRIGANGAAGHVFLVNGDGRNADDATIHLDGDKGDIILQNADCAEDFEVEEPETSVPGTVMVISEGSRLRSSRDADDKRVAGVVAGAEAHRPGIILGRTHKGRERLPVALIGRIMCRVEASTNPIEVGDLLTTSSVAGHAMKAQDPLRAFGAVLGKALAPLRAGTSMIPVLAALQ